MTAKVITSHLTFFFLLDIKTNKHSNLDGCVLVQVLFNVYGLYGSFWITQGAESYLHSALCSRKIANRLPEKGYSSP